jgi:hypothetical protein
LIWKDCSDLNSISQTTNNETKLYFIYSILVDEQILLVDEKISHVDNWMVHLLFVVVDYLPFAEIE